MIPISDKEKNTTENTQTVEKEEKKVVDEQSTEEKSSKKQTENAETNQEANADQPAKEKKATKKKEKKASNDEEVAELTDKYLRVCAEYDNFRKRTQKEKDSLYYEIKANALKEFLPVYDNLVRALDAHTEDEAYRKGVEMIMDQFNKTMEKLGIEEIPALGEKFNPDLHNAIMHVDDESKGESEIVEVFQKGFKIGDKIIRFSMVKVAN